MEFLEKLGAGKVGFEELGAEAGYVFDTVAGEGTTVGKLWETGVSFIEGVVPSLWMIPAVLAVLSLVQVLFGKKLLGFQKFLAFFAVGFACGIAFINPLLVDIDVTFIPDWAVGLIVGLVAALLCKLLYFLSYILAAGGAAYIALSSGLLADLSPITTEFYVAIAAAVVAIVLALLLRKIIETLGTAALGGYTLALSINSVLILAGVAPAGQQLASWAMLAIFGAATFIGFIFQLATRRKDV